MRIFGRNEEGVLFKKDPFLALALTINNKPKKRSPGSTKITLQVQQTLSNNTKTTPPLSP
jgi:hypothetical protein